VIGAGTYADNRSCAVSATGWGEYFIRVGVAQEICTRLRLLREMNYLRPSNTSEDPAEERALTQLAADAVMDEVKDLGGDGGIILVTPEGDALYSFNTSGMYRGRATSEGVNEVAIFAGE
jgi:beta-aspartyl-peptidase (threonine type)